MPVAFALHSYVNPGKLGVNLRFKSNTVIHPIARAAQDQLIVELKERITHHTITSFPEPTRIELYFVFTSRRFDIDGPIKRTIDAIAKAAKALEIDWNDNRIEELFVRRRVADRPSVSIIVMSSTWVR